MRGYQHRVAWGCVVRVVNCDGFLSEAWRCPSILPLASNTSMSARCLRLDAELVLRQLPLAVEAIREALQGLSSHGAS